MYVLDSFSGVPVYEQIVRQTEKFILTGVMAEDSPMPSVRSVAAQISANPNTIQKAYTQMLGKGIIYAVPGKGSFVSPGARDKLREECRAELEQVEILSATFASAGIDKQLVLDAVERGYARDDK